MCDKCEKLMRDSERLRAVLIVRQNAYKTGRNEPLVQAYEHSTSLIAALNGEEVK